MNEQTNSALNQAAEIFMGWCMGSEAAKEPMNAVISCDDTNDPLCMRVLQKRLEVWGIDVKIPFALAAITTICTNGNPGLFMMQIAECLSKYQDRFKEDPNYVISPDDYSLFCLRYDNLGAFPVIYPQYNDGPADEKALKTWENLWDSQKDENGNNLCDTKEWWIKKIYGDDT